MMMKKRIFFLLCLCSVLFFSCKSTPSSAKTDEREVVEPVESVEEDIKKEAEGQKIPSEKDSETELNSDVSEEDADEILKEGDSEAEDISETEEEEVPEDLLVDDETMFDEPDLVLPEDDEWSDSDSDLEEDESDEVSANDIQNEKAVLLEELQQALENAKDLMSQIQDVLARENNYVLPPDAMTEVATDAKPEVQSEIQADDKNETNSVDTNEIETVKLAQENISETEPEKIQISRGTLLKVGQNLVATFPGTDWIYLGEVDLPYGKTISPEVIVFKDKINVNDKTVFTLEAKKEGQVAIHFYKIDNITGNYIDDYVSINVYGVADETDVLQKVVRLPDYQMDTYLLKDVKVAEDFADDTVITQEPVPAPEKAEESIATTKAETESQSYQENFDTANEEFFSETMEEEPELVFAGDFEEENEAPGFENNFSKNNSVSDENLLASARKHFEDGDYETAYNELTSYIENNYHNLDEAYFLLGKTLEAKSPVRDIKRALYSYTYVVENYPESSFWEKASEKEKYIKRFYFNIR